MWRRKHTVDLEKEALTATLAITPEEAYNLLYHNDDFLRSIWESQGFRDIEIGPWLANRRSFSYVKPIGGKLGSCKCVSTEEIVHEDPEMWYEVVGTTQTPDVPSGKSFLTRSKTVFTHSGKGGTRMRSTFQLEWSSGSMLKSMINSQAESGQKQWNKLLLTSMKGYVRDHPEQFKGGASAAAAKEGAEDTEDEAMMEQELATASSRTDFAAYASSVTHWLQEDAVRGLLAIALVLSTLLHVQNYVMGKVSREERCD